MKSEGYLAQESSRSGAGRDQLTGGEVPVVVDDRVEEVRLPGVLRVPHRPIVEEDVLAGPGEIPAVLHVDDEEPVPGLPPRDRLQLGQHLHGELLQVLECGRVPGDSSKVGGKSLGAGRGERPVCAGWGCVSLSPSKKRQPNSVQTLISPAHLAFPLPNSRALTYTWVDSGKLSDLQRLSGDRVIQAEERVTGKAWDRVDALVCSRDRKEVRLAEWS